MKKNAPVLVAVDFSPCSQAALVWAADHARYSRAPLIVLHVVHDPGSAPGSYADTPASGEPASVRLHEEVAAELLEEFLRQAAVERPDLLDVATLRTRVVVGLPASRIVEVAEEEGAQLIVVGSRGRTGLSHILLGSKAQRVAQLSPVPVTVVKGEGLAG